jgi:thiol-disulfide isomerase/thioredoxin
MRRSVLLLTLAVLTGACDKHSGPAEQGNAGGEAANLAAASPDEAAPGSGAAATPARGINRSHAGTPAPAFTFADPAGRTITLASFKGKPVLLNLWATWCGPCVKELPTLDALAAREGAKLEVVTLSQDMDAGKAKAFLTARGLPHLGAYTDPKMQWLPAVTANLPTSILYGADGKERWRVLGDRDWTDAESVKAIAGAR